MAPKGERILRSGRYQSHGKERRNGIQAVCEREDLPGKALRNDILRKARPVMLRDRVGYRLGLAVMQRVLPSHDALQRRELPDHASHEIGLAELGSLPALLDRVEVPEGVGQLCGQGRDAPHFLIEGPELLVEGYPFEFLQPALQPRLAILVEEKLG